MANTHLIIGLGNPGDDYVRTRHNIGFMAVDEIAARYHAAPWKKKFRGLVTQADNFLLLKPQTFMNLSGESVLEAMQFYQMKPEQMIVFHDDLDLSPGHVRVKQGGGTGGHNGLKSMDAQVGPNYWRVRLGIGRPMTEQGDIVRAIAVARSAEQSRQIRGDVVSNYVLNPFAKADKVWLDNLIPALASELGLILAGNAVGYAAKMPKV